jgi:hypothetical protein
MGNRKKKLCTNKKSQWKCTMHLKVSVHTEKGQTVRKEKNDGYDKKAPTGDIYEN